MIPFEKAYEIIIASAQTRAPERVSIDNAVGRVLAEDVFSDINMPPFDKSAMDGYACRKCDLPNELQVIEIIPAGSAPTETINKNQCAKIMTGAPVPMGADCVIMVEYTEKVAEDTIRFTAESTRDNICFTGEDIKVGDKVLEKGTLLAPQDIGVLATTGYDTLEVYRRPTIGIIATGDELVEPSSTPGPACIRNSNSYQLCAQANNAGALPVYMGIAPDNKDGLNEYIKKAAAENDIIILSGGVSTGDYDFVPEILQGNGFELQFQKVAIKPGKPTVFGVSENGYCFGLPGNPVATFVLFELVVKPFVMKLMGHDFNPTLFRAKLSKDLRRKKTQRLAWIPVKLSEGAVATPIEYHGSAHLNAMSTADGLIRFPVGVSEICEGETVVVRQL